MNLESLFEEEKDEEMMGEEEGQVLSYIPAIISEEDTYALLANYNINCFKEKMGRYIN